MEDCNGVCKNCNNDMCPWYDDWYEEERIEEDDE